MDQEGIRRPPRRKSSEFLVRNAKKTPSPSTAIRYRTMIAASMEVIPVRIGRASSIVEVSPVICDVNSLLDLVCAPHGALDQRPFTGKPSGIMAAQNSAKKRVDMGYNRLTIQPVRTDCPYLDEEVFESGCGRLKRDACRSVSAGSRLKLISSFIQKWDLGEPSPVVSCLTKWL